MKDKPKFKLIGFPSSIYTSCYCEENVYLFCKRNESIIDRIKVIFLISTHERTSVFCQRSSDIPCGHVLWDYHVIAVYSPTGDEGSIRCKANNINSENSHVGENVEESNRGQNVGNSNATESDAGDSDAEDSDVELIPVEDNQYANFEQEKLEYCEMRRNAMPSSQGSEKYWVFDFDTTLGFPVPMEIYLRHSFLTPFRLLEKFTRGRVLFPEGDDLPSDAPQWRDIHDVDIPIDYCAKMLEWISELRFRVMDGRDYLDYFSSDRSHMIDDEGEWLAPPPLWPCIHGAKSNTKMNLLEFRSLREYKHPESALTSSTSSTNEGSASHHEGFVPGRVVEINGLIQEFSNQPQQLLNMLSLISFSE